MSGKRERRGVRAWSDPNLTLDGLFLPRPSIAVDGDLDGRALIMVSLHVGTAHGDPLLAFGVDFRACPGSPGWRLAEWLDERLERTHGAWRPLG